jgi:thiopeptide-type bacteriocin biosynthesis protein
MPSSSSDREWLGVHLSFDGWIYGGTCDRVLVELVAPLVVAVRGRCLAERYFFVRYGEGGPHIRLRFLGRRDVLVGEVLPLVVRTCRAFALPGGVTPRMAPYAPEYERYGGPDGVALAERCFEASSDAAIVLLGGMRPGDQRARFAQSLFTTLAMAHAFCRDRMEAAAFVREYGTRYLGVIARRDDAHATLRAAFAEGYERQASRVHPYVEECWGRLCRAESLSAALDPWVAHLRELRVAFEGLARAGRLALPDGSPGRHSAMRRIVPSYLHMMNNRVGVGIPHEAYLATVIASALTEPVSMVS